MLGKQVFRSLLCASAAVVSTCFAVDMPTQSAAAPATPAPSIPQISQPVQPTVVKQVPPTTEPSSAPNVIQPTASAQMWNLKNADIRAVIQTISILTGKNFVVDPRVSGKITLISQKPLTPDEMYQVFLSMLQLLQYAAVPSGNVIKIVPAMDATALSRQLATSAHPGKGDEIVVRVVPINHVSATELVPVLRPLMTQSGSVTAYLPSNTLILAGSASSVSRIVAVIHQMDSVKANQIAVVPVHYGDAKKIAAIIQHLQSGSAAQGNVGHVTLVADEEDNTILVNANASNQLLMRNLIHQLDKKGSSGDDTRVVTLNYLSAKKLAPILAKVAKGISATQTAAGAKGAPVAASTAGDEGAGVVSIQAEDNNNAIIMHGSTKMLNSLTRVIHRLDVRPKEVLVEAIIVKVGENLLNKLGVVWGVPDDSASGVIAGSAVVSSHSLFPFQVNGQGIGLLPSGNLTALLHMFKSNGSSDVLATPSVVVLNNQKAAIDDGKNVGLANRSYQGASATTTGVPGQNEVTPFNTIERQDVTLSLAVVPHISPNHMIRMELKQRDDSVDSTASVTSGSDNPTINTSKIETSVLVKSGDVLVLGGLIQNEQEKTQEKLPILGDLPVIGNLFKYNTHKLEKTCLMVFIRPVIMSGHTAQAQTLHRYAYLRQEEMNVESDRPVKQIMPRLPQIQSSGVALPPPLKTVQLPMPNATVTTGSIH